MSPPRPDGQRRHARRPGPVGRSLPGAKPSREPSAGRGGARVVGGRRGRDDRTPGPEPRAPEPPSDRRSRGDVAALATRDRGGLGITGALARAPAAGAGRRHPGSLARCRGGQRHDDRAALAGSALDPHREPDGDGIRGRPGALAGGPWLPGAPRIGRSDRRRTVRLGSARGRARDRGDGRLAPGDGDRGDAPGPRGGAAAGPLQGPADRAGRRPRARRPRRPAHRDRTGHHRRLAFRVEHGRVAIPDHLRRGQLLDPRGRRRAGIGRDGHAAICRCAARCVRRPRIGHPPVPGGKPGRA